MPFRDEGHQSMTERYADQMCSLCKQNEIDASHLVSGKAGLPTLGSRAVSGITGNSIHWSERDPVLL